MNRMKMIQTSKTGENARTANNEMERERGGPGTRTRCQMDPRIISKLIKEIFQPRGLMPQASKQGYEDLLSAPLP